MRILFCNKYNHPFSGTEVYMFEVMELLRSKGHDVALFSMADPRGEPTPYDSFFVPHIDFKAGTPTWQKVKQAAHAIYSPDVRRRLRSLIAAFQPDVAHVRNIYHHLSPSILWELKAQRVPVLYHINDFKLLCPSYNLVSGGEACEDCKGGRFRHALKKRCYPGLGARTTLMAEAYFHRWVGTYQKCVNLFLAPSRFVRDKFMEHGWDGANFEVLAHFQRLPAVAGALRNNAQLLYFGRLSPEKGVGDLIRAMKLVRQMRLLIAGDGPERAELQGLTAALNLANVEFAGHIRGTALDSLISQSAFTVLPSHAYETMGKTILESYAHGRPVIASDLGSRRELVLEGKTGLLYRTGDVEQLARMINFLGSNPDTAEAMGNAGMAVVRSRHTPAGHYDALMGIYARAITSAKKATPHPQPANNQNPAPVQKPRLRVAFIGGRGVISKYSGIETYYEEVGGRLARLGHDVTVYCRNYFTPPLSEHNGMRLVRIPTVRSKHFETVLHTLLSTFHAITQPFDVVHYHCLGPALFSFLPRLFGKKTMVTVQGLDWQRQKWGRVASAVLRLGEACSARLPNGTTVVSRTLQQRYRSCHGIDPFYAPNGGLLRDRRPPRKLPDWGLEPDRYILFLGRFSPEKGCHLLVEAFEQLDTSVKLVMAGAQSYCDNYSRELRAHAGDRIKMLDWVSGEALNELLTNAMIFVLPSHLEGLSLALLDAMGAGVCVLASDVPENREAIGCAGLTFQRGNAADLTDRLRFLIANPSVRQAAGKAAQQRIRDHYQWSTITAQIEQAYFKIMNLPWAEGSSSVSKAPSQAMATGAMSAMGQRKAS